MSVSAARAAARLAAAVVVLTAARPSFSETPDTTATEGLPIRRVEIVVHNLYDPLPPGRLRPLYRLANALHLKTRDGTVRNQLLFQPGDRWSEARGRESARALRSLGIIEPSPFIVTRVGDSVDVELHTRDDWTTQPEFAIESAGGEGFTNIAMVERNVLGFGKTVNFSYRETPEGITRSASYHDPNLFGSRMRLAAAAGTGTDGASQGFDAAVPFYSEDAPLAYGVRWSLITSVARLFRDGQESAVFDRRIEETEVHWGRGTKRGKTVLRLSGSFMVRDRRFGASRVQPEAPQEFVGGEENLHQRQFGIEGRWWRPDFGEWQGVDQLGGVEDIDFGESITLMAGYSPHWLGANADEGFAGVRLGAGGRVGSGAFGQVHVELTSRLRHDPVESIARIRARWVQGLVPGHTVVVGGMGVASHRPARDFQVILGGLDGLRSFPVRALAGQEAWRVNAEHRWWVAHDFLQLVSIGMVGFYDLGRTAGAGAIDTRWRQDTGFGVRIALPRSGQDRVARLDVAWPVSPRTGESRGPVFSFGSGQAF